MVSVLQVTPELNAGGVERTTLEIAEAISRAGGLALIASAGGRLEPDLEAAGGELIRLPVDSKNPLAIWANAGRLAALARTRGVQIIHARSRAPAWSALWAARRLRLPFVTTYHGVYNAGGPVKRFYNSVMAKGDLVIANSEFTRQHVIAEHGLAPERVIAIARGVDLAVFDRAATAPGQIAAIRAGWGLGPADQRLVLLLPARLTRWKGQGVLIEAAALIERERPGAIKVVLAGDAQGRHDYVTELNERIVSNGLRETVVIAGHISQIEVALAASDVAVFPSIEPEAFGRGAVEAQAMGLPVIAAALGGFTETIIEGETGFLVAPSDAAALAAAIKRVFDLGEAGRAKMGACGHARAKSIYSKSALQEATMKVYDQLLRR